MNDFLMKSPTDLFDDTLLASLIRILQEAQYNRRLVNELQVDLNNMEQKYNALLDSTIKHGEAMMGHMLRATVEASKKAESANPADQTP